MPKFPGESAEAGEKTLMERASEYALSIAGPEPETFTNTEDERLYWDIFNAAYDKYFQEEFGDPICPPGMAHHEDDLFRWDEPYYPEPVSRQELEQEMWTALASLHAAMRWLTSSRSGTQGREAPQHGSTFFRYPEARKDVFEFSKTIAEYLKNNGIKDLVIADRSSRPLYIGVREYWMKIFPDEPMPNMYFINPKGFKSRDSLTDAELQDAGYDAAVKDDRVERIETARNRKEIIAEFKQVYKKLYADNKEPVLLFDTCLHSGKTLYSVVEAFKAMGFTNLKVGSVNRADRGSKVQTDFHITDRHPHGGCYPFDQDRLIEKTFEHVYSMPADDPRKKAMGAELRQEIKKIMEQYLRKPSLAWKNAPRWCVALQRLLTVIRTAAAVMCVSLVAPALPYMTVRVRALSSAAKTVPPRLSMTLIASSAVTSGS
ncbi:MAG: hypothetical protein AAB692_00100 [Patescibacteria group bacterium]